MDSCQKAISETLLLSDDGEHLFAEDWERSRNHQTESEGSRSLEQLMNFLRYEVKGEEMVLLARTGLTPHQNPRKKDYHATQVNKVETTTAAALVNMDNPVKSLSSEPTPLPPDRVIDCAPFEIVGIDLAGPLFLKDGRKVWITLFTCAVYRAIHLELVNSLTSDTFLLALRCFITRRGRPRTIYCDNGTNFRGAFNDLSKLNWSKIVEETRTPKILWKFIPPTAAWWGGWWRRLVRTVKELLKRTLGRSVLKYDELYTVLCDCESIINCRPLTYVSENPEELIPLTPSMFLISNKNSNIEDIEELNSNSLNKRIKYRSKLLKDLRQRFRNEYLSQLIQKHNEKESRDPQIGEVVLVGDDNKKRLFWALAKIIELILGQDGKIRTVRLKTQHGKML
ncbi:integrase catalytic domain-containing protein [Trichonephila clavipes]|nr:integrase catalytic domain-containing protein [Trichonephila clavipes]